VFPTPDVAGLVDGAVVESLCETGVGGSTACGWLSAAGCRGMGITTCFLLHADASNSNSATIPWKYRMRDIKELPFG